MKSIILLRPLLSSALAVLATGSCFLHGTFTQTQGAAAISAAATQESELPGQDLAAWRAQREQQLAAPDGWLTLIGLEWLKPGINSFGSAADNQIRVRAQAPEHLGLLTVSGEPPKGKSSKSKPPTGKSASAKIVQLLAPAGGFPPEMKLDGNPAREGPLVVEGAKPSTISWHGLTLVILLRGDRFVLRIKDAAAPTRTNFHGLNWYAPNSSYRVTAKWIPFTPSHTEKIPTVLGTTLDLPAPGVAEFTLGGKTLRLEPVIEDPRGQTLFFILRDETSKTATYGGGRFLHTGLPDHGLGQPGHLMLDFNRLENPPCAYTPYATCPLPPEQNRLGVALEAGERRFAN
jgi:uncharacterized protein (DUF1684 family)